MYLLQLLDPELKRKPEKSIEESETPDLEQQSKIQNPKSKIGEMLRVEGGAFEMGARGLPFAYDNEQPPHIVELEGFRIDKFPVTNGEYLAFIEENGYQTRSLWSAEGWAWKAENKIEHPLYW